ncbi:MULTISPECIES: CCA tRNA nucleotidyltransferase [unclassified Gemella]|uniref:CCA tRNA nucleotidyltransferase n=1 Tax=unclassified Gemella TaxID=2624949 RepID=UPI001430706C|nr:MULTISPECIES: CCA tRNA nucleotidyltransferase [unclassified Gemella]MBF0710192.1 CCA tRNA nucleotidyltransferase [Gemella sp. GL1.1]MBF0746492.1 CCA tRNA nucleotidyltransferase [Gemella sp. 19428wG2_WT2a]NYS27536.1 CCA tRNA nucleotidyltransferase [Gemella sp. GL1]
MREFLENNFQERFSNYIEILEIINDNGYEAYFVGGCVRDFLMNQNFDDIDITSSARPEEIKQIFPKTFDIGIKHGTVTVIHKNNSYEITTFRSESDYEKHRIPKFVEFIRSLDLDLERRDFTINAMVLDSKGKVIDFHGGQDDIKNKIIKTVNEPNERFNEDALRMLRAFRFVSKLGFSMEEKTFKAIEDNKKLIEFISIERVVAEFKKIFKGKYVKDALSLFVKSGLYKYLNFFNKVEDYSMINSDYSWEENLFLIMNENEIDYVEMDKLKLSKKEYTSIKEYFKIKESFEKFVSVERLVYDFGKDKVNFVNNVFDFISSEMIENVDLVISSFKEADIEVVDILTVYPDKKAGPWLRELIYQIENELIHNRLKNEKFKILNFLKNLER